MRSSHVTEDIARLVDRKGYEPSLAGKGSRRSNIERGWMKEQSPRVQYSASAKHRYPPCFLESSPFVCSTPQDDANRVPPPAPCAPVHQLEIGSILMGAARFGDDSCHLLDLCLGTAEGSELETDQ